MMLAMMLMLAGEQLNPEARYAACVELARTTPRDAEIESTRWRIAGGGYLARQCLGIAYANEARWEAAADEFTAAAEAAEVAHDARAAQFWAQAGNSALASGNGARARAALDAAIAAATLKGLALGEAYFDRGRAFVVLGDLPAARADIDRAIVHARADPLVWLGSAALARRMGDQRRAKADIARAHDLAPDDASVMLEIGNIAARDGDAGAARAAWAEAVRLQPNSEAAGIAREALKQFDSPKP